MSAEDLENYVKRSPFEPFRVALTDGRSFEIRHPELCMIGKRSAALGIASDPAQTRYDKLIMVDLLHIVSAEALESKA